MNEEKAAEIIGEWLEEDGAIQCWDPWIFWQPDRCPEDISLEGGFSADELEALAWWMRNKAKWQPDF